MGTIPRCASQGCDASKYDATAHVSSIYSTLCDHSRLYWSSRHGKSVQIDFGNMIAIVKEMIHWLSVNNSEQAFDTALPLIRKVFDLHQALIQGGFHESSHEAGPRSGGAIQTRWSRPEGRKPAHREREHLQYIAD
jgi:hypothetical protein